jgi:hypothetical protein
MIILPLYYFLSQKNKNIKKSTWTSKQVNNYNIKNLQLLSKIFTKIKLKINNGKHCNFNLFYCENYQGLDF